MDLSVFIWPLIIPTLVLLALLAIGFVLLLIFKSKQPNTDTPWPYRSKKYFFSRSEQEFLKALSAAINHQKFIIFPKVRLADFIEVTVSGAEYQKWWNKIRSKHIDFLIWNIEQSKVVLAIELDGKSHESEKMIERDEFIEKLYETVGLKLERVKVGEDYNSRAQEITNAILKQ